MQVRVGRSAEHAFDAVDGDVPVFGDLSEEEVEDDDSHEAGDEGLGAGFTDAGGACAGGEAFVASDETDGGAEEDAFGDSFEDLPVIDAEGGVSPVGFIGDVEGFDGDEPSADDAEEVGVDGEQGCEQDAGEETRDDEDADGVCAHDSHGVELFGDVHSSELGGEGAANAAGEHDGGEDGSDLFDDGDIDDGAHAGFLSEGFELSETFDGEDHSDEGADDGDDGDGLGADVVHLGDDHADVFPAEPGGAHGEEGSAGELREAAECGEGVGGLCAHLFDETYGHKEMIQRIGARGKGWGSWGRCMGVE